MFEKEYLEAKKTTSFDTSQNEFYHDVGSWKGFRKDARMFSDVRLCVVILTSRKLEVCAVLQYLARDVRRGRQSTLHAT